MRKKFLYILILVIFVGFASSASTARAVDPTGDCYIYYGHAIPPYSETKQGLTKAACEGFKNPIGGVTATWYTGSTAGAAWRCYDGSGYSTSDNEVTCANKNLSWAFGPIKDKPAPANDPTGTCVIPLTGGAQGPSQPLTNITQKDCTAKGGTWSASATGAGGGSGAGDSGGSGGGSIQPYTLLAPLPCEAPTPGCVGGKLTTFDPAGATGTGGGIARYLNLMIKLIIGLASVLAVIMIVLGGMEYMTSELISTKEHGRERITNAILGLLLALGAYTLLYQINPHILDADLTNLKDEIVQVDLESDVPQTPMNGKYADGTSVGTNWETTSGMAPTDLPSWLKRNNGECQTVGQKGCTSTRGLLGTHINNIHAGCPTCQLVLTGGTEFWEHGGRSGNTTHKPDSATVDLRGNPELNKYLSEGKPLQYFKRYGPNKLYLWEGNSAGVGHWHIGR